MKRLTVLVALAGCACPAKNAEGPGQGSSAGSQLTGSGGGEPARASACDAIRTKIEKLYRVEAQAKEPTRVEQAVADNTAMVMADCVKAPSTVVACVERAATVKDIETTCLAPLDDDGTEGDALK